MEDTTEADAGDSTEIDGLDLRAITCRDRRLEDATETDGCDPTRTNNGCRDRRLEDAAEMDGRDPTTLVEIDA